MNHTDVLNRVFSSAEELFNRNSGELDKLGLDNDEIQLLDVIISYAEKRKGVLTVLITSLTHKIFDPAQDVRYHQENMDGGYSGRSIDTRYITPFMKEKLFPSMAESGWLTRTLEINQPYDFHYPGKITAELKSSFLSLLDKVQTQDRDAELYLTYIFQHLIKLRERGKFDIAKPSNININTTLWFFDKHFTHKYSASGAARLPVLAIHSIYQCMVNEIGRFANKELLDLQEHEAADKQTGSIGDVEIKDENNKLFEAVEVKHKIPIDAQMVNTAYEKFKSHSVDRYYILSTANIKTTELEDMNKRIAEIGKLHGCQVIINGILPSLRYYLRLLQDPNKVVGNYVEHLREDKTIKFEHKEIWNLIVAGELYPSN